MLEESQLPSIDRIRKGALAAAVAMFATALGWAQPQAQVARLKASDYGKIILSNPQSLGDAAATVAQQANVFEPIARLRSDDPLAQTARAIVRLDILVSDGAASWTSVCTAAFIGPDMLLTNHHCVPGTEGRVEKASALLDYLTADGAGARRIVIDTEPVEADPGLDYAILRTAKSQFAGVRPIEFAPHSVMPRDRLRLIHHPAGQPKMMTQYRCSATENTMPEGPALRHSCDTLPGSSGGIVLASDGLLAVGLHHSGGLNSADPSSFNGATAGVTLIGHSALLRGLHAATAAQLPTARGISDLARPRPRSDSATGDINEILRKHSK